MLPGNKAARAYPREASLLQCNRQIKNSVTVSFYCKQRASVRRQSRLDHTELQTLASSRLVLDFAPNPRYTTGLG